MSKQTVIPPRTLGEVVFSLANLPEEKFLTLRQLVSSENSFSPRRAELEAAKRLLPPSELDLEVLLSALAFLYTRVSEVSPGPEQFKVTIGSLVRDLASEVYSDEEINTSLLASRLETLLKNSPNHQKFLQFKRLSTGFLPNATGFASFVDVRPSFTEGNSPVIVGYVPIVQLRVRTDSPNPEMKNLVFQIDSEALEELRKTLERTEAKLAALDDIPILGPKLPDQKDA